VKVLQFPLVRITICFVFGILFAHYTHPKLQLLTPLLIIAIALITISYFLAKGNFRLRIYFGLAAYSVFFLLGSFTLLSAIETNNPIHYVHHLSEDEKTCAIQATIQEKLKSSYHSDRYIASVAVLNGKKSVGKILLNIKENTASKTFDNGTRIQINAPIYRNKKPTNPNQFDYSKYLENKQIYAQVYTNYGDLQISPVYTKGLSYYASKLRNRIVRHLEKSSFSASELNVAAALLLGQQQDISKEVIQDYQNAGAVHILSVSGLHVGFVLLFMTFLLKPISNTRRNSFVKLCIVLLSLWSFGILAGLAPSVVRSVTMFSFVAIGLFLRRSVNIYHTLFVSVLLILLIQPFFLFDVGFQLSYLALFFIVWLQPVLSAVWKPKNRITCYFWDIVTVSFAAQIGTLPLSLYYFHQFPGLFFVTNIIVLPMLTLIMGIGLIVMILAAFNGSWAPLLKTLEGSIEVLNSIIHWIASFEDFIWKDIPFDLPLLISSYLLIFTIFIGVQKPSYRKLAGTLIAIVLLQLTALQSKISSENTSEFIIFNKRKNTVISQRNGQLVKLYSSDSILKNYKKDQALQSYLVANFCRIQQKESLGNLYYFKQKKIAVIDSSAVWLATENPDILLLVNSPKINLKRLFDSCKPGEVVCDGSNFKSYVRLWKATCVEAKIPFHDTSEKGFYRIN